MGSTLPYIAAPWIRHGYVIWFQPIGPLVFAFRISIHLGVSENSAPLNPMVFLIIIPIKWLFHWEYTLFSDKPISVYGEILTLPTVPTVFNHPMGDMRIFTCFIRVDLGFHLDKNSVIYPMTDPWCCYIW